MLDGSRIQNKRNGRLKLSFMGVSEFFLNGVLVGSLGLGLGLGLFRYAAHFTTIHGYMEYQMNKMTV